MLRVAASRVPLLTLRLREGAHYFQAGPTYYGGVGKRYYTGMGFSKIFTQMERCEDIATSHSVNNTSVTNISGGRA